jgi:spermidine/putrescine transport system substrate-binding protein
MTKPIDPELLEAMAQHRTSRRRVLGMGGLALGGLAMGPTLLAACSSDSNSSGGSSDGSSAGSSLCTAGSLPAFL